MLALPLPTRPLEPAGVPLKRTQQATVKSWFVPTDRVAESAAARYCPVPVSKLTACPVLPAALPGAPVGTRACAATLSNRLPEASSRRQKASRPVRAVEPAAPATRVHALAARGTNSRAVSPGLTTV